MCVPKGRDGQFGNGLDPFHCSQVEVDINVAQWYKWALSLRLVEGCVHSAAPGQPQGGKEAS